MIRVFTTLFLMFLSAISKGNITISKDSILNKENYVMDVLPDNSYQDYFSQVVGFDYSFLRYKTRGLPSGYRDYRYNSHRLVDFWRGEPYWSAIGGLSSNLRSYSYFRGLNYPLNYTLETSDDVAKDKHYIGLGGITGSQNTINRYSQDKLYKVIWSSSNRTYTNRATLHYQSGDLPHGINVNIDISKRWGRSLSIDGVWADNYGLIANVQKKIGGKHKLELSLIYTPSKRSITSASTKESFELTSNNLYNPNWGFQDGEIRNSKYSSSNQPILTLSHSLNINHSSILSNSLLLSYGKNTYTTLNWRDAPSPYPNYYRYMPSYQSGSISQSKLEALWQSDNSVNQINFSNLYNINSNNSPEAHYIQEAQVRQPLILSFVSDYQTTINTVALNTGISLNYTSEHRYKELVDLLGGFYWLDIDHFLEDNDDLKFKTQNNIHTPNRRVTEGDMFGYNYRLNHSKSHIYGSINYKLSRFYFRAGIEGSYTTMERIGYYEKENFASNQSLGESELYHSLGYKFKIGADYRIGGKFSTTLLLVGQNQPAVAQNLFYDANYRNSFVDTNNETLLGAELISRFTNDNVELILSLYANKLYNQTQVVHFYDDILNVYCDYVLTDISSHYLGFEFSAEGHLYDHLYVKLALSMADNRYDNNPQGTAYSQATGEELLKERIQYEGLHMTYSPETISSISLVYRPFGWIVELSVNSFNNSYITPSPMRYSIRTLQRAQNIEQMVYQEQYPSNYTVDLFGGKTIRLRNNSSLGIYAGVNNLFNTKDIITGGYQSSRLFESYKGYTSHPSKYYYALGLNFFLTMSYTF